MRLHLSRRMRLKLDLTIAVALGLLSAFLRQQYGADSAWFWVFTGVCSVLFLGLVVYAHFILPVLAFRREPKLRDEYLIEFEADGITFRTANIDSRIEWKLYQGLLSDSRTHLLLYGKHGFSAIPRRVFSGADQEAAFLRLVRQSIGTQAVTAPRQVGAP